jgi:hypothetical protein
MIHFICLSHSIQAAPSELQNHCYISLNPTHGISTLFSGLVLSMLHITFARKTFQISATILFQWSKL